MRKRDNFRNSRKKIRALRGRGRFLRQKSVILEKVVKKSLVKLPDLGSLDPKEHFYAKKNIRKVTFVNFT